MDLFTKLEIKLFFKELLFRIKNVFKTVCKGKKNKFV